jgi:hypothetical protein
VGQELTIGLDARSDGAQALARRVPRAVAQLEQERAARAPMPITAAQSLVAGPIVDVSWSVATVEPEEVLVRLQTERMATRAGFSHPHTAVGCAFCRRAAAVYR